jgi:tetratricopeptide (TPR) repeat protein
MIDQGIRWQGAGPAPAAAGPVRSGRIPALADCFSARPESGHGLAGAPDHGDELAAGLAASSRIDVLVGESGYGKTQLAAAIAHGLWRPASSGLQVWITASSRQSILMGYLQALDDLAVGDRGATPEDAAVRFLDWLTGCRQSWLIVLDDVADPGELTGLWPDAPGGRTVITCRAGTDLTALPDRGTRVYEIGPLSRRESLSYLTARLYDDPDQRVQALDLAQDLGCLPLALALATAAMAGTRVSCRQYRYGFATRRQELTARAGAPVAPAEVAWSLTLDRAEQAPPAGLAVPLLALAAPLDPAGIPGTVFTGTAAAEFAAGGTGGPVPLPDEMQLWAGVRNLARAGLVMLDPANQARTVMVHPVVQAAVRRFFPPALLDEAAVAAADALLDVWPADAAPPLAEALRDCAASLREAAGDLLWNPAPHPVLTRAGSSLDSAGLAGAAIGYWQGMLGASIRVLGTDHAYTLDCRDKLAAACDAAGQRDDAIDAYLVSVAERERLQGPGHPDVLTVRMNLARTYRNAGLADEAIGAYTDAVAGREWALGPDHLDTMAARSQLAGACHAAGRLDDAVLLFQRNVADWERILGPDHPETLTECANLAQACLAAGRLDDGIALSRRVKSARERVLGPDHPDTLAATGQLGFAYRKAGRLKDAIPIYQQAMAGRERVLGPDHLATVTARANLASAYHGAKRLREAVPLYERVLADRVRLQGPDHRDSLTARANLAGAYHSAGRLADALPEYERAVADSERVLGPGHADTLTTRANLAHAYHMALRHTDALEVFRRTLADCRQYLGPDHQLTRAIADNLDTVTRA